jgi:undecaprenyl diphosphate synthase
MPRLPQPEAPLPPPVHIAIIMDGNGRWASRRGLPRAAGHKRGAEAAKTAVECCIQHGVSYLTLYAFSSENWKRPEAEISDLMGLLRFYLRSEVSDLHKNGVKLEVIGNRDLLAKDIVSLIESAEAQTAGNTKLTLTMALSYGGRAEIVRAARDLARRVRDGELKPEEIDEARFAGKLFTAGKPDPDLLIRTGGEQRISNFLLWQLAYAEFVFLDTLWPDFGAADFDAAVREYQHRERRYGASGG